MEYGDLAKPGGHPHPGSARPRRKAWALFAVSLLFWPVFLVLTILEEKAGVWWLRTGDAKVWQPIVVAASFAAGIAPLFLSGSASKKIVASICSLLGFAAAYGMVVLIGVSFFNWGD